MANPNRNSLIVSMLIALSLVGIGFGIWLFWARFVLLGCLYMGVWLWNAQRFALWLLSPRAPAVADVPQSFGRVQRTVLAIVCLIAAGISGWGGYWWYFSPEDWQAGLVFILFGVLIFAPVTVREIQLRRNPHHCGNKIPS
jgi:hypothetical protein